LTNPKSALIFGGTGYIGREVVALLSDAGLSISLSYYQNKALASTLSDRYDAHAFQLDLHDNNAIRLCFAGLARDRQLPDVFIHCAAISHNKRFAELDDQDWLDVQQVNAQSVFVACQAYYQALESTMAQAAADAVKQPPRNIILLSAVNKMQTFELPLDFAASQGMINQFAASACKPFGRLGINLNVVVPGMLEDGLSRQLPDALRQAFIQFSALKRFGTSIEVARCIRWLALENTYVNGQCIPVNGGI